MNTMQRLKPVSELPRPRVGIVGVWTDPEILALRVLFPIIWGGRTIADLVKQVAQTELDLLICSEANCHDARHDLDLIALGECSYVQVSHGGLLHAVVATSNSHHLRRVTDSGELGTAAEALCIGLPTPFGCRTVTFHTGPYHPSSDLPDWIQTGLLVADGHGDALALQIADESRNVGMVSVSIPDRLMWVRAFVAGWAKRDRERYAGVQTWDESAEWRSASERSVMQQLEDSKAAFQVYERAYRQQAYRLEQQLATERELEGRGARRILTMDGDELEDAVAKAFAELGFGVERADAATAPNQPKRQDLNLTDPIDTNWLALVEVKGRAKGGLRDDDLTQLEKHAGRYYKTHHRDPTMRIVVINGAHASPPADRPLPFHNDTMKRDEFAAEGGLAIPTTVLYKLLQWVRAGGDAARARALIQQTRGVLLEAGVAALDAGAGAT